MKPWRSMNLRSHLLSVVLVALVPAIGLAVYLGFRLRDSMAEQARTENLRLARVILFDHEQRLALAHNTLLTLSHSSQVATLDLDGCSELFAKVCAQNKAFANILLAAPNGTIIASGVSLDRPITVSDREYFQAAMRTRRFTWGSYVISRSTGKPARPLALPVLDNAGEVSATLIGAFDLAQFGDVLPLVRLPAESTVTAFDGTGNILYRLPSSERINVGTQLSADAMKRFLTGSCEETYSGTGDGGEKRMFSYVGTSAHDQEDRLFVRVSVAERTILRRADKFLQRSLIGILAITMMALLLTQYISSRIIVQPMQRLIAAAEEVENGRLQTRARIPYDHGEFGHLARAFDAMTDALAQRERQRDLVEEELRTAEENLSATLLSIGDAVICTDIQGRVVRMNPVAEGLTGWPLALARGKASSEVLHLSAVGTRRPAENPAHVALREAQIVPPSESILFSRQGKERLISASAAPIRTKDGVVAGAVLVFREVGGEERRT